MSDLEGDYRRRFDATLVPLANAIEGQLREYLATEPHIDRVTARPKSIDRFLTKAQARDNERPKYSEPLRQIQDQVGARIVTFYLSDVDRVATIIEKYFRPIESRSVVPDSQWEFGYFGKHYVLIIPNELIDPKMDKDLVPEFFELQIKTLFQHAWSEANHDLGYKQIAGARPLTPDATRRMAFTAAQAWGADRIFDELYRER
jgi:ppGpp synthetase/RelA/SpoT-type nucleotidyltranferase